MTMSDRTPRWLVIGFLAVSPLAMSTWVLAQQTAPTPAPTPSAPAHVPRPDDLEPGVNTSATPPPSAAAPAASTSGASAPADKTPPPAPKVGNKPAATSAPAPTTNSVVKGGKAEDRLQLDTTEITGNQELPKVLYIVPWKRSDLGDLLGKPANSLLDEVLQPIDRDVFKRENRYYDALKPDAAGGADKGAGAASQGSGDKR
jgi:hypothetical protein